MGQRPGSSRAQFHYDAVTTSTPTNGTLKLTSTGRVGSVKRTVSTVLRKGGFGEFLYYTMYETTDPANEAKYGLNNATAQDKCTHYAWEPPSPGSPSPVTSPTAATSSSSTTTSSTGRCTPTTPW